MLKKYERIKYSGLFAQAYEKGRTLDSKNLKITFTKTRFENSNRLPLVGFVVSKNFSKKAVIRNRYKRKIREAYRLYRLNAKNAERLKEIGLLIITLKGKYEDRKDKLQLDYSNLERELHSLMP